MPYDYQTEKPFIFTEEGQKQFLRIRDRVHNHILEHRFVTLGDAMSQECGPAWQMMACVDRLKELGEIREIEQAGYVPAQNRIFTKP